MTPSRPSGGTCRLLLAASLAVVLTLLPARLSGPCLAAASAAAQAPLSRAGVGYVVNAPNLFLGVSAHALSRVWGGVGLYADVKLDLDSPRRDDGFEEWITAGEAERLGDLFRSERQSWRSVNLALMRPLTREFLLYAGAGYARGQRFSQYIDPQRQRGVVGYYWAEDPDGAESALNLLAGAHFAFGPRLFFQFGVESVPGGATIGASYSLPLDR